MEWKRPSFGWAFSVAVSDVGDSVGDFGVIIGNGGEGFLGRVEGGGCPGSQDRDLGHPAPGIDTTGSLFSEPV